MREFTESIKSAKDQLSSSSFKTEDTLKSKSFSLQAAMRTVVLLCSGDYSKFSTTSDISQDIPLTPDLPRLILDTMEHYIPLLTSTKLNNNIGSGEQKLHVDVDQVTAIALSSLTEAVRALAAVMRERMKRTCYMFVGSSSRIQKKVEDEIANHVVSPEEKICDRLVDDIHDFFRVQKLS